MTVVARPAHGRGAWQDAISSAHHVPGGIDCLCPDGSCDFRNDGFAGILALGRVFDEDRYRELLAAWQRNQPNVIGRVRHAVILARGPGLVRDNGAQRQ